MHLNQIAAALKKAAPNYPDFATERAEFHFDGLTIRCKATKSAILAVAKKYEKGKAYRVEKSKSSASTAPRFVNATMQAFIDDGEWDNAYYYAMQYPGKVPRRYVEALAGVG